MLWISCSIYKLITLVNTVTFKGWTFNEKDRGSEGNKEAKGQQRRETGRERLSVIVSPSHFRCLTLTDCIDIADNLFYLTTNRRFACENWWLSVLVVCIDFRLQEIFCQALRGQVCGGSSVQRCRE